MTNDLLPCPFCGSAAAKQSGVVWCSNCGIGTSPDCLTTEEAMSDWNTRANKPAEVDLDALKRDVRGEKEKRYDMDYTYDLGWNAAIRAVQASGPLTTGKGGGEPAAPTQIDAGELEESIWYCREDWQHKDGYEALYEHMDVIIKAARAHFEKSKGGV